MDKERRNIIKRLEKCRRNHQEFYKNHPDMLEEITLKINALKDGVDYEIKDGGWVVGYVGGKIRDTNLSFEKGKAKAIQYKNTITEEIAKEIYKNLKGEK